ncbi:hypothetical protein FRC20_011550, partial [Serendipita sp. 405]
MDLGLQQPPVVQTGFDDEGVKHLEAELETMLQLRNTLIEEFQKLAVMVQQTQLSGIYILPNELLTEIFTDVIQADPANRPRLQLVSRKWNEIFLRTPILWSTFRLTVPVDIRDIENRSAYWERCIERSAECPLDISLHYSKTLSPIYSVVSYSVDTLPSWIPHGNMARFLLDGRANPILLHLYATYLRPVVLFIAHPGAMERWRSFDLRSQSPAWNQKSCFDMAFSRGLFGRETPMLEKLTFWVANDRRPLRSVYISVIMGQKCQIPFPHTPALKELYLHDIKIPFSVENPEQIERLDTLCGDIGAFKEAMMYRNVAYLRIGIFTNSAGDINQFKRPATFLHLRRLHLLQQISPWFYDMLDAPMLEVVVFEDFIPAQTLRVCSVLPSVKRIEFRWTYMHNASSEVLDRMLPVIIRQSPALETLLVC